MALLVAKNPRDQHAAVLDGETPIHLGVGFTAGVLGVSVTAAVLATIGLEAAVLASREGPRRALFEKTIPASSLANHAADVLATVGGVYLGRWLIRLRH